ncbi:type VII secretion protein EccB [Serinibacter salmoneus]|uniref:Type VII secretion system ESX-1 transmembrane protein B n=1 Tax=Serinibacter salmoneus TaxID=556530 RepID=A0A2A9D612_9MICO|nr:type VII secretion protein EccB [Serinibacter salmoneus]PFG21280.1 type VII secretion system ESX-1 transmembrane protein B [Serinibacter salmoneus]
MPSRGELLQAQRWERRRLLAAFRTGSVQEDWRPGRGVVASLVVAGMALGGSCLAGMLEPRLPQGWGDGRIIVVRESAERFVSREDALVPVPNLASARLLTSADAPVLTLDRALLHGVAREPAAGIAGAPDRVATPESLVRDAWLACAPSQDASPGDVAGATSAAAGAWNHPRLWVGAGAWGGEDSWPAREDGREVAALVTSGEYLALIVGSRRHELTGDRVDGVLRAVGLSRADAREVSPAWLALLEPGDPIAPFEVAGAGRPTAGVLGDLGVAAGDVVVVEGEPHLALAGGDLVALTPFADAVYTAGPGGLLGRWDAEPAQIAQVPDGDPADLWPARWPQGLPDPVAEGEVPCVLLQTASGGVRLMAAPAGEVTGADAVTLVPGTGALVRVEFAAETGSGGGGETGSGVGAETGEMLAYLDETGTAFPFASGSGTDPGEAIRRLLGEDVEPVTVPPAWADLLPVGVALSIQAAESR